MICVYELVYNTLDIQISKNMTDDNFSKVVTELENPIRRLIIRGLRRAIHRETSRRC
jgi:hypothetical protein